MAWEHKNGSTTSEPQKSEQPAEQPEISFNFDLDFQNHDWQQGGEFGGDEIGCPGVTCVVGHRHGHRVRGFQLIGKRGSWSLVKEGGTVRLKP